MSVNGLISVQHRINKEARSDLWIQLKDARSIQNLISEQTDFLNEQQTHNKQQRRGRTTH